MLDPGEMLSSEAFALFKRKVESTFGLAVDPLIPQLTSAIHSASQERRVSIDKLLYTLSSPQTGIESLAAILQKMLLGHTRFYRHPALWDQLERSIRERSWSHVECLDVGCSSGEEPVSIALFLSTLATPLSYHIDALDMSPAALGKARAGIYARADLESIPAEWRRRGFNSVSADHVRVVPQVMRRIDYHFANVRYFMPTGPYHVAFCRNVLTYLTPEAVDDVLNNIRNRVVDGGFLAVAPQETHLLMRRDWAEAIGDGTPLFRVCTRPQTHKAASASLAHTSKPQSTGFSNPGPQESPHVAELQRIRAKPGPAEWYAELVGRSAGSGPTPVSQQRQVALLDEGRIVFRSASVMADPHEWASVEERFLRALRSSQSRVTLEFVDGDRADSLSRKRLATLIHMLEVSGANISYEPNKPAWVNTESSPLPRGRC